MPVPINESYQDVIDTTLTRAGGNWTELDSTDPYTVSGAVQFQFGGAPVDVGTVTLTTVSSGTVILSVMDSTRVYVMGSTTTIAGVSP